MTDKELLEQFFQPMKEMEVADDGFTDSVVRQLPDCRTLRLSRLWTAFCVVVAVTLFVLMRGWEIMAYALLMFLNNLPSLRYHLVMAFVLAGVLGLIGMSDVLRRERYTVI